MVGQSSDIGIEREDECGICMEMNSKIVLPNCNNAMCWKCHRERDTKDHIYWLLLHGWHEKLWFGQGWNELLDEIMVMQVCGMDNVCSHGGIRTCDDATMGLKECSGHSQTRPQFLSFNIIPEDGQRNTIHDPFEVEEHVL